MTKTEGENNTAPKGIGISPKLFVSVIVVLAVIFLVVLAMIFSYRGKRSPETRTPQSTVVNQQSGISPEAAIDQINNEKRNGVLTPQKNVKKQVPKNKQTPSVPETQTTSLPQNDREAMRSAIAVVNNYHGPATGSMVERELPGAASKGINGLVTQKNQLNAMAQSSLGQLGKSGEYTAQNMQHEKTAFLTTSHQANNKFYLNSTLTASASPYAVKAGTIIPATLLTGINSDLPGQITAQVSQNIYDTVTGNYLLIPQGTKVIGVYDSKVAYGQSRILIAWSRLIYPNGDSFDLQGQPGVDLMGMAGLHDLVDNHYVRVFGSALMFSLFGALGQLSQPQQANNGVLSNQQIIYGAIGQQMSQTGAQLIEKNINIQPTLNIRPGNLFNILLTRDMVLPGPYASRV